MAQKRPESEEYENEYEYEYEQEKQPQRPVKKGGFLGKFICVILGIIIGMVAAIGGVAGTGYFLAKKKTVKEVFGYTKLDYSTYISEEYAQKTVWDLIGESVEIASQFKAGTATLNTLDKVSPYVGKQVENLVSAVKRDYGIALNYDGKLMDTPFGNLNAYFKSCVENTPAGDLLLAFGGGNSVLNAICYGVDGESALTVKDFAGTGLSDRINSLPLDVLIKIKPTDSINCTLAYGEAYRYRIENNADGTQTVKMNQLFYRLEIDGETVIVRDDSGALVDCVYEKVDGEGAAGGYAIVLADGKTMQFLSRYDENNQTSTDESVYYVYATDGTEENTKPVLFPKTTVGELQEDSAELINKVTLQDAMNITDSSHKILRSLAVGKDGTKRTIGDLRQNSKALIDEIYLTDIVTPDPNNKIISYLLYGKADIHYSYDETTKEFTPLQKQAAIVSSGSTLSVYNEYGELQTNATATSETAYTQDGVAYTLSVASGETIEVNGATVALRYVQDENGAVKYVPTRIADLSGANAPVLANLTSRLTLCDVVDVPNNDKILKHLKDVAIKDIAKEVQALTIMQVFEEDIHYLTFEKDDVVVDSQAGTTTFTSRTSHVYSVSTVDGKYTYNDGTTTVVEGDYINEAGKKVDGEHRVLTGTWSYLLTDWEGKRTPNSYTLTEMQPLIDNMTHNMKNATLNNMYEDEILLLDDPSLLTTRIHYVFLDAYKVSPIYLHDSNGNYVDVDGNVVYYKQADGTFKDVNGTVVSEFPLAVQKQYYGELTVTEMVSYLTNVINEVPEHVTNS